MSFRQDERTLGARILDIERRLRAVEQPGAIPPDPGWVLREIGGYLYYVYVPTGKVGPIVGVTTAEVPDTVTVIEDSGIVPTTLPPSGAAGGVLSGTYPDPGFAVDMATQAELDAHITDPTDAHDASAISYLGGPGIAAVDVEGALDELATEKANIVDAVMDGDAAGGVLSGTYPNPGFAVDMATQAELDAVESGDLALRTIGCTVDGQGSVLSTGALKIYLEVPWTCTIESWTLLADQSGSTVVDVWVDSYANFPPTNADSITAADKPTISAAVKATGSALTGWTTTITAGDIVEFEIESCSSITKLTISLQVRVA